MQQQALIDALNNAGTIVHVTVSPAGGAKTRTEILNLAVIAAASITGLADCATIDLHNRNGTLTISVGVTYNAAATAGIRVHVITSTDNINWDTEDWDTWNPNFVANTTILQTKSYDTAPAYIKVLIQNLDAAQTVTAVSAVSVVG